MHLGMINAVRLHVSTPAIQSRFDSSEGESIGLQQKFSDEFNFSLCSSDIILEVSYFKL